MGWQVTHSRGEGLWAGPCGVRGPPCLQEAKEEEDDGERKNGCPPWMWMPGLPGPANLSCPRMANGAQRSALTPPQPSSGHHPIPVCTDAPPCRSSRHRFTAQGGGHSPVPPPRQEHSLDCALGE